MPKLEPDHADVLAIQRLPAIPTILKVVAETTGLRFSAVARVTNDEWIACAVHDGLEFGLKPGGHLDVATTLCSEVRDTAATIVMDHASRDPGFCQHPTPKMYGFESYVSVPIFRASGEIFGTICALDPKPRPVNQPHILESIRLFADLISMQLEADDRASETKRASARLAALLEHAPAAISVLRGPELVFEITNELHRTTTGRSDLVGKPVREARPELTEEGITAIYERVYATGETYVAREAAAVRDGRHAYHDWSVQATHDDAGAIDGVLTFSLDVTERVLARATLEDTNRELERFAFVASHDLKAPLRGIANVAKWLEEDLAGALTPAAREHLRMLGDRVKKMNGLIEGVLQLSRAGVRTKAAKPVDVRALIIDVVGLLAPAKTAKIAIADGLPTLHTSEVALQQVFLNLVGNALKHAGRPDVVVTVTGTDEGDDWRFSVADNGVGIPEDDQRKVWDLFATIGAEAADHTGIGLSIVKKTVEARLGSVGVESKVGQGSTFSFTWPKVEPTT